MDRNLLWTVTTAMSQLLEIMTYLDEDPNYSHADANTDLEKVLTHLHHIYEYAKGADHETHDDDRRNNSDH